MYKDLIKALRMCPDNGCVDCKELCKTMADAAAAIKSLTTQLAESKADYEAAVEDLRRYPGITPCIYCKNYGGEKRSEKCTFEGRTCFEYRGRNKGNG